MQLTMILLGGASLVKVGLYELFTIALTRGFDHVLRPVRVTNNGKTQDSALVWRQARQVLCNFEAWMIPGQIRKSQCSWMANRCVAADPLRELRTEAQEEHPARVPGVDWCAPVPSANRVHQRRSLGVGDSSFLVVQGIVVIHPAAIIVQSEVQSCGRMR